MRSIFASRKAKLVGLVGVLGVLLLIPLASASGQGTGNLMVGDVPPGGFPADLEDRGGETYLIRIIAQNDDPAFGHVTMTLEGPSINLCTARGPGAGIDFDNPSVTDLFIADFESATDPPSDISCGTAYGQRVEITGCEANIQFHGYMHSDAPGLNYMGMTTVDVSIEAKSQDRVDGDVEIHTPSDTITLKGRVLGNVSMETCPDL